MRTIALAVLVGTVAAQAASPPEGFLRVAVTAGEPRALQVAVVGYRAPRQALRVDLVGAVHIGDPEYYQSLNDSFADYDAVLYELVGPDGVERPVPRADSHASGLIGGAQSGLKDALGLAHQLAEIDYRRDNFVHADLSWSELSSSMAARNESAGVYFWRMLATSLAEQSRDPLGLRSARHLGNLFAGDWEAGLKTAVAYQLVDSARIGDVLGGEGGSAVVEARNQRAIDVLRREIDAGARRIGIFYGVAHMPDLEQRLVQELSLERADTTWLDAWRLTPSMVEATPPP